MGRGRGGEKQQGAGRAALTPSMQTSTFGGCCVFHARLSGQDGLRHPHLMNRYLAMCLAMGGQRRPGPPESACGRGLG